MTQSVPVGVERCLSRKTPNEYVLTIITDWIGFGSAGVDSWRITSCNVLNVNIYRC